jgi:hypothetical protein
MKNLATLFVLATLSVLSASVVCGQYKLDTAGAPPGDLAPALAATLQPQGIKVLGPSGSVYCEIWLRSKLPSGPKSSDEAVTLPTIPQGALLGVIRFAVPAQDRRGQALKAGTYTMRYSQYPVNGDHQGVAPQRDFALLAPAANDADPEAAPGFDALVALSTKASGTPHPAVLSIWASSGDKFPSLDKQGDHDWVLDAKVAGQPISFIVAGKVEG